MSRSITPEGCAWAAGFFEGEGSIILGENRKQGTHHMGLSIWQNDPEPLEKFRASVGGLGKVYGPYRRGPSKDGYSRAPEFWFWQTRRMEHVQAVVAMMWAGLSRRRRDRVCEMYAHYRSGRTSR